MNRGAVCLVVAGLLAGSSLECRAASSIFEPREDEIAIAADTLRQPLQGLTLAFPISAFLSMSESGGTLRVRVRAAIDLRDLQRHAGELVDSIPLPNNNCGRRGGEDVEVRIWGKQLDAEPRAARLILHGDATKWVLCKGSGFIPFPPFSQSIVQPFDVETAFRLESPSPQTVELKIDKPEVTLGGSLGGFTAWVLGFLNVDLGERLQRELARAVDPNLLRLSLPQELSVLRPAFQQAELGSERGALVASLEIAVSIDTDAVELLMNSP